MLTVRGLFSFLLQYVLQTGNKEINHQIIQLFLTLVYLNRLGDQNGIISHMLLASY